MRFKKRIDVAAPRPVYPRNVGQHGLFGLPYLAQHFFVDERWTPISLTEEFSQMADLLRKRLQFATLDNEAGDRIIHQKLRKLRRQCRTGRKKLQHIMYDDSHLRVRNVLVNHRDMRRLYQRMSIHQVVDNINQRTFVMRKERDRLLARQEQLKNTYSDKMILRSNLENRIKYLNEFSLDEEIKVAHISKLIFNSSTRLTAIKTINSTYQKIVQILNHDAIFYEQILSSLDGDIRDQGNFIKYILHLGTPALTRFKQLNEDYRKKEDRARKQSQLMIQMIHAMQTPNKKSGTDLNENLRRINFERAELHFVRESSSMNMMKQQVERIEDVIKTLKCATYCSTAKDVYSRIRYQVDSNDHLRKTIENDDLGLEALGSKMKCSSVLREVLINNIAEENIRRTKQIEMLEIDIKKEDDIQANILSYLKLRAQAFVLLRYSLWNVHDIMRYVSPQRASRPKYKTLYLKLPLLKFEMLDGCAVPPDPYEENVGTLVHIAEKKLKILMKVYSKLVDVNVTANRFIYENEFINTIESNDQLPENEDTNKRIERIDEDFVATSKAMNTVPSRKQIKAHSAKIVEENIKVVE